MHQRCLTTSALPSSSLGLDWRPLDLIPSLRQQPFGVVGIGSRYVSALHVAR